MCDLLFLQLQAVKLLRVRFQIVLVHFQLSQMTESQFIQYFQTPTLLIILPFFLYLRKLAFMSLLHCSLLSCDPKMFLFVQEQSNQIFLLLAKKFFLCLFYHRQFSLYVLLKDVTVEAVVSSVIRVIQMSLLFSFEVLNLLFINLALV